MASLHYQILAAFVLSCVFASVSGQRGQNVADYSWGPWTDCNAACGSGSQSRKKTCADGNICQILSSSCNQFPCDDPYSDSEWSECSASCGGGTKHRFDNNGENMQEIMCNMQDCEPVTGDCRGDIVFILDSSHSIGSQNWFVVKQFVMDVIHGLKISADQTRVGVVSFATMTVNNFHLQEYYDVDEMAEKIWEMAYLAGSTNTADGIMFMRQMMAMHRRPDVQQIAILLTDGVSNVDAGRTIPEADAAKDEDIEIFVVAVGDADQDEVRRIASDPRWLFNVTDFTALNSLTMDIIEETCSASELVNCGPCEFSSCSESCGADGTQTGEKECKRFERFTSQLVETFIVDCADQNCFVPCPTTTTPTTTTETTTTPTTTTETTTTPTTTTETTTTPTTTTETTTPSTTTTPVPTAPPPVDCHKCDFTKGQIWRPDPENCHRFYICEPLVDANSDGISDVGEYRIHHMTCDELYWDQDLHTCVEEMPANAQCDQTAPPVPFTGTTPAPIDCPYEPKANDPQFFSGANDTDYQKCSDGMIFVSGLVCTCVENPRAQPTCADDLLLHFTYEGTFNDVTCHHAIANMYGSGLATLVSDDGHSAVRFDGDSYFEVPFIRTFFAGATIREFSISLWFKQDGAAAGSKAVLVTNGDCEPPQSFEIFNQGASSVAECGTTSGTVLSLPSVAVSNDVWQHVAWVYDGSELRYYLGGSLQQQGNIQGPLMNPDAPLAIGAVCGSGYYSGLLDEIRFYTRVLSLTEVQHLAQFP